MHFDIAIIGSGVVGVNTALELATADVRVALVDARPSPFLGSARAGFGSLTPFSDPYFSGELSRFAAESVSLYRKNIIPGLLSDFGGPIDVCDVGLVQTFLDSDDLSKKQTECVAAEKPVTFLDRAGVLAIEPELNKEIIGGILYPEPWVDLAALLALLERRLAAQKHVTSFFSRRAAEIRAASGEYTVRLADGGQLVAKKVVVATGLSEFALAGLQLPAISWVRGEGILARFSPPRTTIRTHVYMGDGFITPRSNGDLLLGSTYLDESARPLEEVETIINSSQIASVTSILDATRKILPSLNEAQLIRTWSGWRPRAPDGMPILGPHPNDSNIVLALGFIGLGTTMAPKIAQCVRSLLFGEAVSIPVEMNSARAGIWGASHGG